MLFLADENIGRALVNALRQSGHDVKDIKEQGLYGISDDQVLEIANRENRIILTHDKDFLNLSRMPPQSHSGITILRFLNQNPKNVVERFLPIAQSPALSKRLKNAVVIVSETHMEIIE